MSVILSPPMVLQFQNPNSPGNVLAGGKLFTYVAGTSTKQATWTDSSQSVQNANPIILDSTGSCVVWLDPTLTYKFVLAPSNDTDPPSSPLRTVDNIQAPMNLTLFNATITQSFLGGILYPQTSYELAAGVTPTSFIYPPGHAWRYGMVNDGTLGASTGTDNTAAFNKLVLVCRSSGTPQVSGFVPCGIYRFASKPNTILSGCAIRGESSGGVQFLRDYIESTPTNGFIESNSGALVFEDIYLLANNGNTGGTALHLVGQVGGASPDFSKIRIPYISGNNSGTWAYGILADGSARVGPPAGIRDLFIDDTNVFSCTTSCMTLKTINNGQIRCAVFPAGGTASDITVTGISGNPSNNLQVTANFDTTVNMDWSNNCQFFVAGNATITNTSAVSNAYVLTSSLASTQNNWLNSMIETPTTGVTGYVSAGIQFTYGKQQSLIGTNQTISVAAGQTINTNAGVVQNITNSAGANLTTTILQAGTLPFQQVEVMNGSNFTITFDVAATSNVADGSTSAIPALTSRKFTWNSGISRWFRSA